MCAGTLPLKNAYYGEGDGPILLDDIRCRGTEGNLLECSHAQPLFRSNCNHSEDAAVNCQGGVLYCYTV